MSDAFNNDGGERPLAIMSTERPLDALLPELAAQHARAPIASTPVHQRVLESVLDEGFEWLFSCWRDPGGHRALHEELLPIVEATLLSELSKPPSSEDLTRRAKRLRFALFDTLDAYEGSVEDAVRLFGFTECDLGALKMRNSSPDWLQTLHREAAASGWQIGAWPESVWEAPVAHHADAHLERLHQVQHAMRERLGAESWGMSPGLPSKVMAEQLEVAFHIAIEPDLDGLRALERLVVLRTENAIRWIPPLIFQGLCDFIGVLLHMGYGAPVEWAVSDLDDTGLASPPHFRFSAGTAGPQHLAIGLHLMRWCVMPISPGEDVASLASWVDDEFG